MVKLLSNSRKVARKVARDRIKRLIQKDAKKPVHQAQALIF